MHMYRYRIVVALALFVMTLASSASPQTSPAAVQDAVPTGVETPAGYVIGPEDVLTVVFWREKDISGDVIVRPDGMISLPLINEVQAAGQTPDQLRIKIGELANKYLEDPNVAVVVKQINSRKVFITGNVNKIGTYPLTTTITVLQLITMAGGLQEYADQENIVVVRNEKGRAVSYRFNYKDVVKRRNLAQNIQLLPGDTVVVP
ncbi:MAG TPA: polysaccharide biosynthesis/export family protein [Gemmatimonadaceae bacterium]|nr:polysaccharide biosynthesis/export family protein [Gemmatimonadaceae bacterium]